MQYFCSTFRANIASGSTSKCNNVCGPDTASAYAESTSLKAVNCVWPSNGLIMYTELSQATDVLLFCGPFPTTLNLNEENRGKPTSGLLISFKLQVQILPPDFPSLPPLKGSAGRGRGGVDFIATRVRLSSFRLGRHFRRITRRTNERASERCALEIVKTRGYGGRIQYCLSWDLDHKRVAWLPDQVWLNLFH